MKQVLPWALGSSQDLVWGVKSEADNPLFTRSCNSAHALCARGTDLLGPECGENRTGFLGRHLVLSSTKGSAVHRLAP